MTTARSTALHMIFRCWIFVNVFITRLYGFDCEKQSHCYTIRPDNGSFSDQVVDATSNHNNRSVTILVYSGNYSAKNESINNFIDFENITIIKHSNCTEPATVSCSKSNHPHNGIGFENCHNIFISGLSFAHCGTTTSGLYFYNTTNLTINNSTFHSNLENGIQIVSGNNISISNCHFFNNIQLHNDTNSRLIGMSNGTVTGGCGLYLFFRNQNNITISVHNCTFTDNISYKITNFQVSNETRPYAFIPFGNGGGMNLQTMGVTNLYASVTRTRFSNNVAIHQGGGVVMISNSSANVTLNIFACEFVGNKALGHLLNTYNEMVNKSNVETFIQKIITKFSDIDFITKLIQNASFSDVGLSGGLGGAIGVGLYGQAAFNRLVVRETKFFDNFGIITGAVGFVVRDALSEVEEGVDTNTAIFTNCNFTSNTALYGGTAFGVASYARVDVASQPIEIKNCTFEGNRNLLPTLFSYQYGFLGAVSGIRFPVRFRGTNTFRTNYGGGVAMYHSRVDIKGEMRFYDNHGAAFGGALRIGELTLVQLFPNTSIVFVNNSASQFGGAIAVQNFRGLNDTTLILNNNCFFQYNIGCENENNQYNWKALFNFNDNEVTEEDGEGQAFFAEDIRNCILPQLVKNNSTDYEKSVFSVKTIFNFTNNSHSESFVTAPHTLVLGNKNNTISASPGEVFKLYLHALDENNNVKYAVYSYPKPVDNIRKVVSSGIVIDLNSSTTGFAALSREVSMTQNAFFMLRNATWLEHHNCTRVQPNISNSTFILNLIDSSNGEMVYDVKVIVDVQCCHAAYRYNSYKGKCIFAYNQTSVIRRDRSSNKYVYVKSERYGGYLNFTVGSPFVTAKIPPSYQNCTQEGKLSGCLVKDDDPDQQCSQERTGFLCGSCTKGGRGVSLSLIECVSCDAGDVAIFVLICILIVVISILSIYFNLRLPSALKGFLFFIQVVGYVYRTGVVDGEIKWHFYLSRFFGFSLFVPVCISPNLSTVEVAMFGFIPPVLMAMCILTHIVLARFIIPLSKRKTVDGIWFLVLIIYVYTADTCLNLLRCVQVYEPIEFKGKRVYYFDGSLECFGTGHVQYGVIAIIVSVLILIPLPLYVLAVSCNWLKNTGLIRDIIGNGIRPKHEWWSSYDLGRRLLFVVIYLFFDIFISEYTEFALTFAALMILIIASRVHPYTERRANLVEWLIMLDLVIISAYFVDTNRIKDANSDHLAVLLLLLPFIYCLLYLICKAIEVLWKKWILTEEDNVSSSNTTDTMGSSYPMVQGRLSKHRATLQRWSTIFRWSQSSTTTLSNATERIFEGENSCERFRDELLADYVMFDK